jgi:hypothetical protein
MPRLESWSMIAALADPYKAPEQATMRLAGLVYGHPRFADGDQVTTSSIESREGEIVITASGTRYELGAVLAEYERLYPNARARLMACLPTRRQS